MHLTLAKCHACLGDKGEALLCLQRYASCTSLTHSAHEFAGNLLLSIGAYKDAARAFSYLPEVKAKPHLLEKRVLCNLAVKELSLVIKDLKLLAFTHGDRASRVDLLCLEALKEFSQEGKSPEAREALLGGLEHAVLHGSEGKIFRSSDVCFFAGVASLIDRRPQKAREHFETAFDRKLDEGDLGMMELEFSNRTFNQYEYLYCLFLAEQMGGHPAEAELYLTQLLEQVPKEQAARMGEGLGGREPWCPFPVEGRLSSIYPPLAIGGRAYQLSFCMPRVELPEQELDLQESLLGKVQLGVLEGRPDAPWIERGLHGVVFTQELITDEVELDSSRLEELGVGNRSCEASFAESPVARGQLLAQLRLDPRTEARLARLSAGV
jgi:tetratricopeptide (TPR) repeat protein